MDDVSSTEDELYFSSEDETTKCPSSMPQSTESFDPVPATSTTCETFDSTIVSNEYCLDTEDTCTTKPRFLGKGRLAKALRIVTVLQLRIRIKKPWHKFLPSHPTRHRKATKPSDVLCKNWLQGRLNVD